MSSALRVSGVLVDVPAQDPHGAGETLDGVSVEDINVVFMNRQPGQAEGQDGQDQHTDDNSREHDHTLNNSGVIFFCGAP